MRTRCLERDSVPVHETSSPPSALEACNASLRSRLLTRLGDEAGIALIMALGIMLVLTIALASTIYLASSSGRHAHERTPARRRTRWPRRA